MDTAPTSEKLKSLRTITTLIYALYALVLLGVGITAVVAIVMNYVKMDDVRGSWLESHFRWQIRTFWFSLLWFILGAATLIVAIGWAILAAACIWYIYRIAKGWLYLNDNKPMYVSGS